MLPWGSTDCPGEHSARDTNKLACTPPGTTRWKGFMTSVHPATRDFCAEKIVVAIATPLFTDKSTCHPPCREPGHCRPWRQSFSSERALKAACTPRRLGTIFVSELSHSICSFSSKVHLQFHMDLCNRRLARACSNAVGCEARDIVLLLFQEPVNSI